MDNYKERYITIGGKGVHSIWTQDRIGKNFYLDDIHYKITFIKLIEKGRAEIGLEALEGVELLKAEIEDEVDKCHNPPKKNIPAFIRALNEDMVNITNIIPLQPGEDFARYLHNFLYGFDSLYNEDDCAYTYKHRVTYDEEWREWSFGFYKFLIVYSYDDDDYFQFCRSLDEMSFDIERINNEF